MATLSLSELHAVFFTEQRTPSALLSRFLFADTVIRGEQALLYSGFKSLFHRRNMDSLIAAGSASLPLLTASMQYSP